MALVARNALWGGRRAAIFTAVGVASGLAVWTLAASVGVASLLRASEPAFVALKLTGAAYLVFLGIQALRAAFRREGAGSGATSTRAAIAPKRALRQGLLSNLANPKIAVFFTSFLPQFVPSNSSSFRPLLVLGAIFCALTLVWLTSYAAIVAKAGDLLRRPRIRRALDGLTGAALVAFGIRLATSHR